MKKYNFAVVGATGMVGRSFLRVMSEQNLPIDNLYLFASKRSAGQVVEYMGKSYVVEELTETSFSERKIDIALFSAGSEIAKRFAPLAAASGCVVIDNSKCFRMDGDVPLVVPEVNPEDIKEYKARNIIANPNCSTIQAMPVIKPILDRYGVKRVVYSTYQAVSGAGKAGYDDLELGVLGEPPKKFDYPIAFNCIPHIDDFLPNGYTKEEQKMIDETRKILHVSDMRVTATCVRVAVYNGHSESINLELERDFNVDELRDVLRTAPGVIVTDEPNEGVYPMPVMADGHDEVYVGRIRRDDSVEFGVNMFVVADNIRKGAATNAVQIALELINIWEREGR